MKLKIYLKEQIFLLKICLLWTDQKDQSIQMHTSLVLVKTGG